MLLGSFLCSGTFSLIYSHLLSFPFPLLDCVFCVLPSSSTPQPCGARGLTQFCLVYVCVCVHACMHGCVHACTRLRTRVYVGMHVCALCICVSACMCVRALYLHERAWVRALRVHLHECVCVCMCIHVRVCPLCSHGLRAVPGSRWCSRLWVMSSFIFPSGGTVEP